MYAVEPSAVLGGPLPAKMAETPSTTSVHADISPSHSEAYLFTKAKDTIPAEVSGSSNDCLICETGPGGSICPWVCSKPYRSWPLIELVRQYEILGVRYQYEQLCQSLMESIGQDVSGMRKCGAAERSGRFAPRESFNRWLMERRSVMAAHVDPLIPSPTVRSLSAREDNVVQESPSASIAREILDDLPMKIHIGETSAETRGNILRFSRLLVSEIRANPKTAAALSPADVEPIMQWIRELQDGEETPCIPSANIGLNARPQSSEDSVQDSLPQPTKGKNHTNEDSPQTVDEKVVDVNPFQGSTKEDVYNTVRLARPVVERLYAEKVSRVVRQLQQISRDAANRVEKFCKSGTSSKETGVVNSPDASASRETFARQFKRRCVVPRGGEVQFGSVKWMSGRNTEFFEFTDDLNARFEDACAVSAPGQQNLSRKYAIKGYKLAQLWRRFALKSGTKGKSDSKSEVLCRKSLDAGCVCEGQGWRGGDWTCTCVRDLINRIRSVESIGPLFASAVFALLCRYHCICGCQNQGKGLQCAVPPNVLDVLREDLEVNCELFASPFNVYLDNYCSIFPDVDVMFGSWGSFFDPSFELVEGSFEANPPFDEVLMARMVERLLLWLRKSEESQEGSRPLSFCLSLPDWSNGPSDFMDLLKKSKYLRYADVIPEGKHSYLNGFQHFCHASDLQVPAVCGTFFAVLQNDAGTKAWPVTDTFIKRLKEAWSAYDAYDNAGVSL
nr:TPA: Phosphorylated CTD-interacting factor 1,putative [Neospora caninum Liverpool]